MIPCYICAKDASTGWIKGFTPAPDSQKLALCSEHDTSDNRLRVAKAWQEMRKQDITAMTNIRRAKVAPSLQILSVHFTGGGMLSFTCTGCSPTDHGTLRIDAPDGTQTFIPMRHIREYTLSPYIPENESVEQPSVLTAQRELPEAKEE